MILTAGGTSYRNCTRCGLFLSLDKFHLMADGPQGHRPDCKKCFRKYKQERAKGKS